MTLQQNNLKNRAIVAISIAFGLSMGVLLYDYFIANEVSETTIRVILWINITSMWQLYLLHITDKFHKGTPL